MSVLNKTTTHISESGYMLYTCIMKPRNFARKQYRTGLGYWQLTNETVVCKILDPSFGSQLNVDQMRVFLFNKGKDTGMLPSTSGALNST